MSLLSDIGTAIKNKLGGTSVDNTVPRYDGTTCKLQGSGVTISDTNAVTASGGFVGNLTGNASTSNSASGSVFFTSGSGGENEIGCKLSGYSDVYLFSNTMSWGVYSASGGSAFHYIRSTGKFNFNGNADTATNAIGYNQSWQDVTASRASGVTYTNSTGKPIAIAVFSTNGNFTGVLNINGISVNYGLGTASYYAMQSVQIIVPNNSTYSVTFTDAGTAHKWLELR